MNSRLRWLRRWARGRRWALRRHGLFATTRFRDEEGWARVELIPALPTYPHLGTPAAVHYCHDHGYQYHLTLSNSLTI